MTRVLLFARDPGGANTLVPVVPALQARGHVASLFGKDAALARFRAAKLAVTDARAAFDCDTIDGVRQFLRHDRADVIVTGTSADDFTEKYLWMAAEELGIPSLAIVDQWLNYGIRFARFGVSQIDEYERAPSHPYLPTRIGAPDEVARAEMIAAGLPAARIVVCGQPYFELVRRAAGDQAEAEQFCVAHKIAPTDRVVIFASEPITTTFGDAGKRHYGYTELTIIDSLIRALSQLGAPLVLVIRPHPKEGASHFAAVAARPGVRVELDDSKAPWPLMMRADLVCGMSSMYLLEAATLKRPIMSIQIGLACPDPFLLSRSGIVNTVTSDDELVARLRRALLEGNSETAAFETVPDPVDRVLRQVEELSCRSSQ